MKIVGINASPKGFRSETLKLVQAVLNGAAGKGAAVEMVDLCRLHIEYCNACGVCYKKGRCTKRDDFQALYKKILTADGLVMGSPNYFRSITAQMKTMLDRMADAVHCQLLAGKYAVNVTTAGGSGQERQVLTYLNRIMLNFGCYVTGSAGASMALGSAALEKAQRKAFRLGGILVRDIETKRVYAGQKKILQENRKYFRTLVEYHKDEWVHEYQYWSAQGRK
jgi:multimeric flavodoxin WrbA